MGLILRASCGACGFAQEDLRLGATHEQIADHDVSHSEVFQATCCGRLQSVRLLLGQGYPDPGPACEFCEELVAPRDETRYRISTMKGEDLAGHRCPVCAAPQLSFEKTGSFT